MTRVLDKCTLLIARIRRGMVLTALDADSRISRWRGVRTVGKCPLGWLTGGRRPFGHRPRTLFVGVVIGLIAGPCLWSLLASNLPLEEEVPPISLLRGDWRECPKETGPGRKLMNQQSVTWRRGRQRVPTIRVPSHLLFCK
jgi:hypothetical protein